MKYILSDTSITLFANNRPYTVRNTHPQWDAIQAAIRDGDEDLTIRLIDLETTVATWAATGTTPTDTHPKIVVEGGQIRYGDRPLHTVAAARTLRMVKEGFNAKPMVRFLERVLHNPSNRAVEELYKFLDANNLPITEKGTFYAYKRIREDWMDVYSGTIKNTIGTTVTMDRNAVNDNPNETCSHGLHVASLPYLAHYSGSRLVLVEVDPADVVSVPIDYNNTKMRVCKYTVVAELNMEEIARTDAAWKAVHQDSPVEDSYPDDYKDDDDDDDDYDDDYKDTDDQKATEPKEDDIFDIAEKQWKHENAMYLASIPFDPTNTPLTTI